jgi:glutathione S-transferase
MHLVIGNRTYSSWSMRGWLMARQSGIAFDETLVPLDQPDTAQRIRQFSPAGKVPLLTDGSLTVWDSLAMAEYFSDRAPDAGIWPSDPAARAVARSVSAEMHSGFAPLRDAWPMNLKRTGPPRPPSTAVQADIARIDAIWCDCRARFGGDGPFLFGAWSAADAMYAPVVSRFISYGAALSDRAAAYRNAVWTHEWFVEWRDAALLEPWAIEDTDVL